MLRRLCPLGGVAVLLAIAANGCGGGEPLKEVFSVRHVGEVGCLAFSPDGRSLVAGSKGVARRAGEFWKGKLAVWDVATTKEVASAPLESWALSVAFNPKGDTLAVGCGIIWGGSRDFLGFEEKPGELLAFEFPSLRQKARIVEDSGFSSVSFASDGKHLASSSFTSLHLVGRTVPGKVKLWHPLTLRATDALEGVTKPIPGLSFSPDGRQLAVADTPRKAIGLPLPEGQGLIRIFDVGTGREQFQLPVEKPTVYVVAISPCGKLIATLTNTVTLRKFKTGRDVTPAELVKLTIGRVSSGRLAFSPDGRFLAVLCNRGGASPTGQSWMTLWDMEAETERVKFMWPEKRVLLTAQAFSPDSRLLAIGTDRGNVKVFKVSPK